MPHDMQLDELPAGLSTNSARGGEQVQVLVRGFASTEDGATLITWLDGLVSPLLRKLSPPPWSSQVDHLVALLRRNKTATVFVNELKFISEVRTKRAVSAGSPILIDDVADFGRLRIEGVEIPNDVGLIVLLSSGWRKGLYFDFAALDGSEQMKDVTAVLGSVWGYLCFQDRLAVTEEQWARLLDDGWFPFVGLKTAHLRNLLCQVSAGWNPDELLPVVADDLKSRCSDFAARARSLPVFESHAATIEASVNHFLAGDVLSASGLLYPRIEGILRVHAKRLPGSTRTQKELAAAAAHDASGMRLAGSLLMPERFQHFLEAVYFAKFGPGLPDAVSRNSVSHGVAPETKMNLKAATIALLTVEQLLYLCAG